MHSASGSNHYTALLLPYKLEPKSLCDSLNVDYRKFFMKQVHSCSNFPYTEDNDVEICSIFPPVRFSSGFISRKIFVILVIFFISFRAITQLPIIYLTIQFYRNFYPMEDIKLLRIIIEKIYLLMVLL